MTSIDSANSFAKSSSSGRQLNDIISNTKSKIIGWRRNDVSGNFKSVRELYQVFHNIEIWRNSSRSEEFDQFWDKEVIVTYLFVILLF